MKSRQSSYVFEQKYRLPKNFIEDDAPMFLDDAARKYQHFNIEHHRNVFVNTEGVLVNGLKFSASNLTDGNRWLAKKYVGFRASLRIAKNVQFIASGRRYFLPFDNWSYNYFHFLLDLLPKLYYGRECLEHFVIVLPDGFPTSFTLFLKQSGFHDIEVIRRHRWVFCQNLFLPELVFKPSGVFNEQYLLPFRDWLKQTTKVDNCSLTLKKKIYLSRKNACYRRLNNEEAVASLLKENGFEILYAESLSVQEQANLFSQAQILVSVHGAGLSNMIFMPTGGIVVELRLDTHKGNNIFFRLASVLDHQYYYLKCSGDNDSFQEANLFVDLEMLFTLVKSILVDGAA